MVTVADSGASCGSIILLKLPFWDFSSNLVHKQGVLSDARGKALGLGSDEHVSDRSLYNRNGRRVSASPCQAIDAAFTRAPRRKTPIEPDVRPEFTRQASFTRNKGGASSATAASSVPDWTSSRLGRVECPNGPVSRAFAVLISAKHRIGGPVEGSVA
ncbi:hypothetical protein LY76DRAFT_411141 [Colletotrichum caudatum]|nr:hypothetical protein LY76DRAFT_411141 [Colletotrichum caudatum]